MRDPWAGAAYDARPVITSPMWHTGSSASGRWEPGHTWYCCSERETTIPLFLQVKECVPAAHAPYLPPLPDDFHHNGKRVVAGQRALQASSDPMLGYTSIDGRDYYVRQMKNLKASIPVEFLTGASFNFYAWACGAILARAHARTGDPARIAGYCGNSIALDEAMAEWAESYGDQTEEDHATLLAAIKRGDIKAVQEGNEE